MTTAQAPDSPRATTKEGEPVMNDNLARVIPMTRTQPSTEIITINPEFAQELLSTNTSNRPVNKANLEYFCELLRAGRFALTHQGIAIDSEGTLIDGQHRLLAIVMTGITVDLMVTYDLPPETFSKIDSGKIRNGSDTLTHMGYTGGNDLAAGLRLLYNYNNNPESRWRSYNSLVKNDQIAELAPLYPDMADLIPVARRVRHACGVSISGALVTLYLIRDHDAAEAWIDGVVTGANLSEGDPRLAYRNVFHNAKMSKRRIDNQEALALGLKSFLAFTRDKPVKVLGWRTGEKFPRINPPAVRKGN